MDENHEESLNENEYQHQSRPAHESEPSSDYTQEQVDAVKKILQCKDHYEILGVTKEATETELKNAYRRLALQFHPDKNECPGATEAFQAISNAFDVLNDPQKRAEYEFSRSPKRTFHYEFYRENNGEFFRQFEAEVNAEELFNMFFNQMPGGPNVYPRRGRQKKSQKKSQNKSQNTSQKNESKKKSLWKMLWEYLWKIPWMIMSIIQWLFQRISQLTSQLKSQWEKHQGTRRTGWLLILISMMILVSLPVKNNFLISDNLEPIYSFQKSGKYLLEKHTTASRISYYVEKNFNEYYDGGLSSLETTIEKQYIAMLRQNCYSSISTVTYPRDPTPNSNTFLSTSTVIYPLKLTPGSNVYISSSNVIYPLKPEPRLDINCFFDVRVLTFSDEIELFFYLPLMLSKWLFNE